MKIAATKFFPARRSIAAWLAAIVLLATAAAAPAQPADVGEVAHGTSKRLYVGMAEGGSEPETWIQYRTQEQPIWRPFAQFDGRAIGLSHSGGELVVLMDNGSWQLIWDNGRRSGRPLPDRRRILALGSDGTTLFAVGRIAANLPATSPSTNPSTAPATQPTHTVGLWTMQPTGWTYLADLPIELDPTQPAQVRVIAPNGQPLVAVHQDAVLHVIRLVDQAWEEMTTIDLPARGTFQFIPADPVWLWTADEAGPGRIRRIDDTVHAPVDLAMGGDTLSQPAARTATGLGDGMYLVFDHKGKLGVQAHDPNGQTAGELDTLGPPHPPTDPRISELIHLVVLAAMLFVLVTTLRQRKLDPIPPEAFKQVQMAPLMPRFYAGLIDVSPFLVAMGWVVSWAQTTPDPAETLVQARAQWPVLLATAFYIAHTLIGEVFFGRSFGKWCLKLRIASVDGHPPTPTSAAMRNLLRIIDLVVLFPLPLLLILYTPLRQRIGDIAARTIVIRDLPDSAQPERDDDESIDDEMD